MKKIGLSSIVCLYFFITGCSAAKVVISNDYKNQKITGKNLMVVPLFIQPVILNPDDVVDDLGEGVPEEVYMSYFEEKFTDVFRKTKSFKNLSYSIKKPYSRMTEKMLEINRAEKMKILLPEENSRFGDSENQSDFIIFLDNLQVTRKLGRTGMMIGNVYTGGSAPTLFHKVYFVIWDVENNKIVSYGRVDDESVVFFAMTEGNWESVIQGIVYKILRYSPFPIINRNK